MSFQFSIFFDILLSKQLLVCCFLLELLPRWLFDETLIFLNMKFKLKTLWQPLPYPNESQWLTQQWFIPINENNTVYVRLGVTTKQTMLFTDILLILSNDFEQLAPYREFPQGWDAYANSIILTKIHFRMKIACYLIIMHFNKMQRL